jgi:hypothetical protein
MMGRAHPPRRSTTAFGVSLSWLLILVFAGLLTVSYGMPQGPPYGMPQGPPLTAGPGAPQRWRWYLDRGWLKLSRIRSIIVPRAGGTPSPGPNPPPAPPMLPGIRLLGVLRMGSGAIGGGLGGNSWVVWDTCEIDLWPPLVLSIAVLLLLHWRRRRVRRETAPLCQHCGYNLTGNVSGICPECGQEIKAQPIAKA